MFGVFLMIRVVVVVLWYFVFQQYMKGFEFSLFDKFFDDELYVFMFMVLCQFLFEEFKSIVVCDIEFLFNMCIVLEEEDLYGLLECKWLLFMYGLNDFFGLSLVSFYDCNYICQLFIKVIEWYELCLQYVNVLLEINECVINVLCFGISVVLLVGLVCELVSFDVML